MGDLSNEPSMEEILSSIKRIIAEDSEAQVLPPRKPRSVASTAVKPGESSNVEALATEEEPEVLELTEIADSPETKSKTARAMPGAMTAGADIGVDKGPLVSDATAEASRASLAALSALVVQPEVHGSDTLEGLVRAMLKPALADWLEARLPEIVERMVAQEIRRITDRS